MSWWRDKVGGGGGGRTWMVATVAVAGGSWWRWWQRWQALVDDGDGGSWWQRRLLACWPNRSLSELVANGWPAIGQQENYRDFGAAALDLACFSV